MAKQYRIKELTTPTNTFTPEFSNDGVTWFAIGQATCLTKAAAEYIIERYINSGGGNVNEIIHEYNNINNRKPLFD